MLDSWLSTAYLLPPVASYVARDTEITLKKKGVRSFSLSEQPCNDGGSKLVRCNDAEHLWNGTT